ncbi:winged helix-turn-helix domain-containing protein [Variovorax sp. RCC_210]|uniref:winged helix-turn-helix domain-containing protein n=1 Tax=Variovorax sp. RCC_210 TaxID=3239217 RepID=UPI003524A00F
MKTIRAALVDHSESRRHELSSRLRRIGPSVREFRDTNEFLEQLARNHPCDVLIMAVTRHAEWLGVSAICRAKDVPVLLCLEALQWRSLPRSDDFFGATVIGFTALSDDELEWRIEALLHQSGFHAKRGDAEREVTWGDYRFVMDGRHVVIHRGLEIQLQPLQFDLAITLFGNVGHVVSRDLLMRSLWKGSTHSSRSRALDVCVARVRTRLALRKENGFELLPVYGRGYKLVAATSAHGDFIIPHSLQDGASAPVVAIGTSKPPRPVGEPTNG